MNIKWDADKYTSDFSFVHHYGNDVMELITASKGSSVLDLGCGNGALSKTLQEKGYTVKGIDASRELLEIAKKNYPEIEFMHSDAANFSLQEPVDVVFSNAVLHWIDKERQPDLLQCVYQALNKEGQFIMEFGGYGNNQFIHESLAQIFAEHHYSYKMPFYFPTISEYTTLLENTGFSVRFAALFDRMTELKGEQGLKDWINMFLKTPLSLIEDEGEREAIINEAAENLRGRLYRSGKWYADYVRIRIKAIK